jgi:outer membrane protein
MASFPKLRAAKGARHQPRPARFPGAFFCAAGLAFPLMAAPEQDPAPQPAATYTLTVPDLARRVLDHNMTVQEKLIDYAISQRKTQAERGVFEPEVFGSYSHEADLRQNSSEQAAQSNGVPVLQDMNNLYEGGVEDLIPTGAKVRMGYDLSDLNNNIPPSIFSPVVTTGQYEAFAGVSVTQPLLKNFGTKATMAQIRLAALSSKIAFQEYRRELMTAVGTAEATYWNLYLAQQQVGFFEESVNIADKILRDSRALRDAGKGSDLEVLEAQAGVGLRQAKLDDARQKVVEATDRLISLYGEAAIGQRIELADSPTLDSAAYKVDELRTRAHRLNPDYLIQQEKSQQELVRLGYARNQSLFEVNLKGAYGLNALADTPYRTMDTLTRAGYPSWSFGVELRVPILGGVKGRNELAAARLQATSAEIALSALETEIANGLDTAHQKLERARSSAGSYQSVVRYNQSLLNSALVSLDAGKIESRKVLEIDSDLFDAKNSVLEALVHYKVAQVELGMIAGSILEDRHLEITLGQLQSATAKLASTRKWNDDAYRKALEKVHQLYPAD